MGIGSRAHVLARSWHKGHGARGTGQEASGSGNGRTDLIRAQTHWSLVCAVGRMEGESWPSRQVVAGGLGGSGLGSWWDVGSSMAAVAWERGIAPPRGVAERGLVPALASRPQTCDSPHRGSRARLDFPALPATSGLL